MSALSVRVSLFIVALCPTLLVACGDASDMGLAFGGVPDDPLEADIGAVRRNCVAAGPNKLVINEVLADPSGQDVNGDQFPDPYDDEFVEILNRSADAVDLSGVTVAVGKRFVHVFPPSCLAAGEALALFGGGAPVLPEITARVADTPLRLTNTGAVVSLYAADSITLLDRMAYGAEADGPHSLTRMPDGVGDFVVHPELNGTEALAATPGRCVNGAPFPACAHAAAEAAAARSTEPPCPAPLEGELIINEVLADPTGIDANGDGVAFWQHDEFVEVVVLAESPVATDGVALQVNGTTRALLPDGCWEWGTGFVVFGGGDPGLALPPLTHVVTAEKSLGLTNSGAVVQLLVGDTVVDQFPYGPEGGHDQSLTRFPDLTGFPTLHTETTSGLPASPGRCSTLEPLFLGCLGEWVRADTETNSGDAVGENRGSTDTAPEDDGTPGTVDNPAEGDAGPADGDGADEGEGQSKEQGCGNEGAEADRRDSSGAEDEADPQ